MAVCTSPLIRKPRLDSDYLDEAMHALIVTWAVTADGITGPLRSQTFSRVRDRTLKVLERLYKNHPSDVITSCAHLWASRPDGKLVCPNEISLSEFMPY